MGFTHLICQAASRAEQQPGPLEDSRPPFLSVPGSWSWKKLQENKLREARPEENDAILESGVFFFLSKSESPTPLSPVDLKTVVLSLS